MIGREHATSEVLSLTQVFLHDVDKRRHPERYKGSAESAAEDEKQA